MKINAQKALQSELSPYKKWQIKWSIAAGVVFAGPYSVAMSNLGFQSIFAHLFEMDFIKPMRFFYDMQESPEGDLQPKNLPVLFFSIPFELDYMQALKMLKNWDIPLSPSERDKTHPVLICGGAAPTLNPKVPEGIFDAVIRGDFMAVLEDIEKAMRMLLAPGGRKNFIGQIKKLGENNEIYRIERKPEFSRIVSSLAAFRNMFLIEIQKSCIFKCGFCATPYIYGDFRNFDKNQIMSIIQKHNPGTDRIGLVGSAIAEHPELGDIISELTAKGMKISTSSIRMDRINQSVMDTLYKSGANSITIAPETHIEKLYSIIGKHITANEIIKACRDMPFNEVKLYYIIGFEGEKPEDVAYLGEQIARIAESNPKIKFSISINPFIPKPGTRLAKDGMQKESEIKVKYKIIKKSLQKSKNIRLTANYSFRQRLEALIALGDIEIAKCLIESAHDKPIKHVLRKNGIEIKDAIYP